MPGGVNEFKVQEILNRCFDPTNNRLNIGVGAGIFYVNDDANAQMTVGITINQGANDNEAIALKSSDVAHGMTGNTEADTFGYFGKTSGAGGGLSINGFTDPDAVSGAILLLGVVDGTANTNKTTAAVGIQRLISRIRSGTGTGAPGANANLLTIEGTATAFIFDVEGSAHADVEWVAFAKEDDLVMVKDMELVLQARETEAQTYRRHQLEEARIIGEDSWHIEDGKLKAMVNFTKLAMLRHGALIQIGERFSQIERQMAALQGAR